MKNQPSNLNAQTEPDLRSPFISAISPDGSPRLRKAFTPAEPTILPRGLIPTGNTDSLPCSTRGSAPTANTANPQPVSGTTMDELSMHPPVVQKIGRAHV